MNIYLLINLFILNVVFCDESKFTYKGGWPINPTSNEINDPGFNLPCPGNVGCECIEDSDCINNNCNAHPKGNFCNPKKGDLIPRFEGLDQFGQSVDLYDFANQDKIIILELSAGWCSPCNDLASWIATNDLEITNNRWWKDRYFPIRDMINSGEVILINCMYEGFEKKITVTPHDVQKWYDMYPDPNVPILADEYRFLHSWVMPTGLPTIFLIDENMQLINYSNRGLTEAFMYLTQPKK
mgnify:FL=1|tara:strand:- start:3819 stop:4538 length:720 start_codon:yes stop_codon:yes gene_type:complete